MEQDGVILEFPSELDSQRLCIRLLNMIDFKRISEGILYSRVHVSANFNHE